MAAQSRCPDYVTGGGTALGISALLDGTTGYRSVRRRSEWCAVMVFMPTVSTLPLPSCDDERRGELFGTTATDIYNGMWNYGAASLVMLLLIQNVAALYQRGRHVRKMKAEVRYDDTYSGERLYFVLLALLCAPILIIMIFSFTEAKV